MIFVTTKKKDSLVTGVFYFTLLSSIILGSLDSKFHLYHAFSSAYKALKLENHKQNELALIIPLMVY